MRELVGFCAAQSNTGKTTLLEKLLRELRRRGISAAVLKHSHHIDLNTLTRRCNSLVCALAAGAHLERTAQNGFTGNGHMGRTAHQIYYETTNNSDHKLISYLLRQQSSL